MTKTHAEEARAESPVCQGKECATLLSKIYNLLKEKTERTGKVCFEVGFSLWVCLCVWGKNDFYFLITTFGISIFWKANMELGRREFSPLCCSPLQVFSVWQRCRQKHTAAMFCWVGTLCVPQGSIDWIYHPSTSVSCQESWWKLGPCYRGYTVNCLPRKERKLLSEKRGSEIISKSTIIAKFKGFSQIKCVYSFVDRQLPSSWIDF